MIKTLLISGLRGFSREGKLNFSIPNGNLGSGLTTIVGPNNSGKSTIVEALRALNVSTSHPPSFSVGKRNISTNSKVTLKLIFRDETEYIVQTADNGGSQTFTSYSGQNPLVLNIFAIKSRRTFNPYFGQVKYDRKMFMKSFELE